MRSSSSTSRKRRKWYATICSTRRSAQTSSIITHSTRRASIQAYFKMQNVLVDDRRIWVDLYVPSCSANVARRAHLLHFPLFPTAQLSISLQAARRLDPKTYRAQAAGLKRPQLWIQRRQIPRSVSVTKRQVAISAWIWWAGEPASCESIPGWRIGWAQSCKG